MTSNSDPNSSMLWLLVGLGNPNLPHYILCKRAFVNLVEQKNTERIKYFIEVALEQGEMGSLERMFDLLSFPPGTIKERIALYQLTGLQL